MARQTKNSVKYEEYRTSAEPKAQAGDIPVFCAYDKLINPKELVGNLRNPNRHPHNQIELLAHIIQAQGWRAPITVSSRSGFVVRGHGRLAAALHFGAECVPVDYQNYANEAEEWADLIADNRLAELSETDDDRLAELLKEIDTSEVDNLLAGFDGSEFDKLLESMNNDEVIEDEEYEPDVPEEPKSKQGDIYQLGEHRLICGDSTDSATIDKLMGGAKADMVFTDAPYGVSAVNSEGIVIGYGENHLAERGKYAPIIGDDTTETAQQAYDMLSQICDKMILWGGNYFLDFLPASDGWLIWDKRGETGIRNKFADGEMAWCSFHTPVRIYHQLWNGMIREGEHEKRVHPTQKPIRMLSEILQDFTNEGDIILDVFGGSGSTLIACEQLNRKCYMAELDPHYIDVIIDRWEQFTGQKAVLIKSKK